MKSRLSSISTALHLVMLLVLAGCGGNTGPDDTPARNLVLAGEPGNALFLASFSGAEATNANLTPIERTDGTQFRANISFKNFGSGLTGGIVHPTARQIDLSIFDRNNPIAAGRTYSFGTQSQDVIVSLSYSENAVQGRRVFRVWNAVSGDVIVESVTAEEVVVKVSGARLASIGGKSCGDLPNNGFECIDNTATGTFTLDITLRFPRSSFHLDFAANADSNAVATPISSTNPYDDTWANVGGNGFRAQASQGGLRDVRQVTVDLTDEDGTLQVGETFTIGRTGPSGRNRAKASYAQVFEQDDGYDTWSATEGTIRVEAIRGNVVTLRLENVRMVPKEGGARGAFTVQGTLGAAATM